MNLYVVMGQYGEYEDTCYWAVEAYTNEEEALAHAQRANDWYKSAVASLPPHEHLKPDRSTDFSQKTPEEQRCWLGRCKHPGPNPFDSIGIPDETNASMRTPNKAFKGCSGEWYYVDGPIYLRMMR